MTTLKLIINNSKRSTDFDNLSSKDYPIDSAIPALIMLYEELISKCPEEERESATWGTMEYNLIGMLYTHILEDGPTDEEFEVIHILIGMGMFRNYSMEVVAVILSNWGTWDIEELKGWINEEDED